MIHFKITAIPGKPKLSDSLFQISFPKFFDDAFKRHPTLSLTLRGQRLLDQANLPGADMAKIDSQLNVISRLYQRLNSDETTMDRRLQASDILDSPTFKSYGLRFISPRYSLSDMISDYNSKKTCGWYVADRTGVNVMTNTHYFKSADSFDAELREKGFYSSKLAKNGDIIVYFGDSIPSNISHIGVVDRMTVDQAGQSNPMIHSKFGIGEVMEHPINMMLPSLGRYATFYSKYPT